MNLKDLLQFVEQDGKVIIAGEDGEVKGVFLSFAQYQLLSGDKPITQTPQGPDPEKINREILEAQLTDTVDLENKNLETIVPNQVEKVVSMPTPIKNILSRRAKDLFMNQPYGRQEPPEYDMREEVMDPNFGKPTPQPIAQPLVETEADEEIKPNFDDI